MENTFIEIEPYDCLICKWNKMCEDTHNTSYSICDCYEPIFGLSYEDMAIAEYEQDLKMRAEYYNELVLEQNLDE